MQGRPPQNRNASAGGRVASAVGSMMSAQDVRKLKTQLESAKELIKDLQEELSEQNNLYQRALKQKEEGEEKFNTAKEQMARLQTLVDKKVNEAMKEELAKHRKTEHENLQLRDRYDSIQSERDHYKNQVEKLQERIAEIEGADQIGQQNVGGTQSNKTADLKKKLLDKDREIEKLMRHVNYIQDQIEEFMDENKLLRDMIKAPVNFGKNREAVKLLDRDKIDDYRKLIRVLQDDNYRLEEERARLKWKLRQAFIMQDCKNMEDIEHRFNLSPDQKARMQEFLLRLVNKEPGEPSDFQALRQEHEKLKAKFEALQHGGFDTIKLSMEEMVTKLMKDGDFGAGLSKDQYKMLQDNYNDLSGKLVQLLGMQGGDTTIVSQGQTMGALTGLASRLQPPVPMNADAGYPQGQSFKFQSEMLMTARAGGKEIGKDDVYEIAFLQMELQECFMQLERKDEAINEHKRAIDQLHMRVKRQVLMQDHLYKDFVSLESQHKDSLKHLQEETLKAKNDLIDEKKKVEKLSHTIEIMEGRTVVDKDLRIIELTKSNTLLEINLNKMSRKYTNLEEQNKLLQRNYSEYEKNMSDMQVACENKINSLKEWKRNATYQMKIMHDQLKGAYPEVEYEILARDIELERKSKADLMTRNAELTRTVSDLQSQVRKSHDQTLLHHELTEYKDDLEKEFNIVRAKLENFDFNYRWVNQQLYKIVDRLHQRKISITSAFERFDLDKNGLLSKSEMIQALRDLRIDNLTDNDVELLLDSIDLDHSGEIDYKEFSRKLQRCGLRVVSNENRLMREVITSLKSLNLQTADLFNFINKEASGFVTRQDFRDMLNTRKIKGVNDGDIEKFIDGFYKEERGDIDLRAFIRIFTRFEKQIEAEDNPFGVTRKVRRKKISTEVIRKKQEIFKEIREQLHSRKLTLRTFFKSIDVDDSYQIDVNEFIKSFIDMGIGSLDKDFIREIFRSIDIDESGEITWSEFDLDFNKTCSLSLHELVEEEARMFAGDDDFDRMNKNNQDVRSAFLGKGPLTDEQAAEYRHQIQVLDQRLKQSNNDMVFQKEQFRRLQELHDSLQIRYDEQRKELHDNQVEYIKAMKKVSENERDLAKMIPKDKSEQIEKENIKIRRELFETKSALLSHQNMSTIMADQVKSLKLMHERHKDENESLQKTLRDLQSEENSDNRINKLYYVIMLSRWQEAAVNKKYEDMMSRNNMIQRENMRLNQEIDIKVNEFLDAKNTANQLRLDLKRMEKQANEKNNTFVTQSKLDEMDRTIAELYKERTDLELKYYNVRSECVGALDMLDHWQIKAEHTQKTIKKIQQSTEDDLTDELIKVSDDMQKVKLEQLKASRLSKEKEERIKHLENLLKNKNNEVASLEEEMTKAENNYRKKEQKFRVQDNQRMQEFFNYKFSVEHGDKKQHDMLGGNASFGGGGNDDDHGPDKSSIGSLRMRRDKPAIETLNEQEMSRMTQRLAELEDDVNHKDRLIKQMKRVAANYDYMRGSDDAGNPPSVSRGKYQQDIDEVEARNQNIHDEEAREMAEAATKTVQTLNVMLGQKKQQLENKDTHIESLRQQLADLRAQSNQKYMKLQHEYNELTRKNSDIYAKYAGSSAPQKDTIPVFQNQSKYNDTDFLKMSKELEQLRTLTTSLRQELESAHASRNQDQNGHIQEMNRLNQNVANLQQDLIKEGNKRKKLAQERKDKYDKLQSGFKEETIKILQENQVMKDQLETYKRKLKLEAKPSKPLEDDKFFLANPSEKHQKQIEKLKEDFKTKEDELAKQKKKVLDLNNQIKEKDRLVRDAKNDAAEKYQQVVKLQSRNEQYYKEVSNLNQKREELKHKNDILNQDFQRLTAERTGIVDKNMQGQTYQEMLEQIQGLQQDKFVLQSQKKQVIALNPKTGSFEYLGQPLNPEQSASSKDGIHNIHQLMKAIKNWFQKNERLSVSQVFQHMDPNGYGDLKEEDFRKAMERLGIDLTKDQQQMLKRALDPDDVNRMFYQVFIREILGIPQKEFIIPSLLKMAKVVEQRDLSEDALAKVIDPEHQSYMKFEELADSLKYAKFGLSESEVKEAFCFIAEVDDVRRISGFKVSIQDLVKKINSALVAIILEKVRLSMQRVNLTVNGLYQRYDKNKDGILEQPEFDLAMKKECDLDLSQGAQNALIFGLLDRRAQRGGKAQITSVRFKQVFEAGGFSSGGGSGKIQEESKGSAGGSVGTDLRRPVGVSPEEMQAARRGARKIMFKMHNTIRELIGTLDLMDDGIISKSELQDKLQAEQIGDLEVDELTALMVVTDPSKRGYVAAVNFLDKLYDLSDETEADAILRRIYQATRQLPDENVMEEIRQNDGDRDGNLEKLELKKALKNLKCTVSETDLQKLFESLGKVMQKQEDESKKNRYGSNKRPQTIQVMPLRNFIIKMREIGSLKPLPAYVLKKKNTADKSQGAKDMSALELEKKHKRNLETLKQEIEDRNITIESLNVELKKVRKREEELDRKVKRDEDKKINEHQKPPRQTADESTAYSQAQEIVKLQTQISLMEDGNYKLKETMQVKLKAELGKVTKERDKLLEKMKDASDEIHRQKGLIDKMMSGYEYEAAIELQIRIDNLTRENKITEHEMDEQQEIMFKCQEQLLELKFEKENFDLVVARLNKRIQDLNVYKESTAHISAQLQKKLDLENEKIDEEIGKNQVIKKKDPLKLKPAKKHKTVEEMEVLIEALKRSIELLKTENADLKIKSEAVEGIGERIALEKQLRTKISNLEQQLHAQLMKEVNLDEEKKTIKKLIEANKQLREDIQKENERYMMLESRYKELILKFNQVDYENESNRLKLGSLSGANMTNYDNYLNKKLNR